MQIGPKKFKIESLLLFFPHLGVLIKVGSFLPKPRYFERSIYFPVSRASPQSYDILKKGVLTNLYNNNRCVFVCTRTTPRSFEILCCNFQ